MYDLNLANITTLFSYNRYYLLIEIINLYFIGSAGSGKSTLTSALTEPHYGKIYNLRIAYGSADAGELKPMDMEIKEKFNILWKKYFNDAELPITFYYTDEEGHAKLVKPNSVSRCVIGALSDVMRGSSLCFDIDSIGCFGGKRYLGFTENIMPNFEYFLSCGIPGKLEGERYKKSPELVKEMVKRSPVFKAPARFVIFKRWDMLEESDNPEVVIFFARPDVLSGLFTLANFDEAGPNGVIAPMGSGCGTIIQYPYLEKDSNHPRGVIGMFDISARPFVPGNVLTLSVPMSKFITMIENMEESFLITESWHSVQKRID